MLTHHSICSTCWVLILLATAYAPPAHALLNPAVAYCQALGYEPLDVETKRGVVGACKLDDGTLVNDWDFYTGRVAIAKGYCAKQGYGSKRGTDGPYRNQLLCVLADSREVPAAQLMNLALGESMCGDGRCGVAETFESCAVDCPSGSRDDFCDGVADGRCDQDCVDQGETDVDCDAVTGSEGRSKKGGCGCQSTSSPLGVMAFVFMSLAAVLVRRACAKG